VPIRVPESPVEVPEWTGDFEYKPAIKGHPPPRQENGKETEVSTNVQTATYTTMATSTVVNVVTATA
jgi:hypothetical protein